MITLRPKTEPPRGVLRSRPERLPIDVARFEPPEDLAPFVEHFWTVHWDLREHGPHTQEVLPHPSMHWVTERKTSEIQGIVRGRFQRALTGRGYVRAVKFRPGAFGAFADVSLHAYVNQRIPAVKLLGSRVRGFAAKLRDKPDAEAIELLVEALRSFEPRLDSQAELAGKIVDEIARDREIISVAQVCDRWQIAPLRLQRLFRRKIGITPKWVVQRYRLHEVIERVHAERADATPPWAAMAVELGFTDQAHFARTFREFVGVTPSQYVRRMRAPAGMTARAP
jgi:AraC-like DNA-binding protein